MSIHPAELLCYTGGVAFQTYGVLSSRTAPPRLGGESLKETFSRASVGWFMGHDGLYHKADNDVPRPHWLDTDDDGILDDIALLVEDLRTNQEPDSTINTTTAWGGPGLFTLTAKNPLFDGETPYEHEQNGGQFRSDIVGTFSGDEECAYLIVENVDADYTDFLIYDSTAAGTIVKVRLTWSTGAASVTVGSGTAYAFRLLGEGPNGGEVYLLAVQYDSTGKSGNTRQIWVYPTGSANSVSSIPHHVQLENETYWSTPIVTSGGSAARSKELCSIPHTQNMEEVSIYSKHFEWGDCFYDTTAIVYQLGDAGSAPPFLRVFGGAANAYYRAYYVRLTESGSSSVVTNDPGGTDVALGQVIETVTHLRADGALKLTQIIDGGAEATAGYTAAIGLTLWNDDVIAHGGFYHKTLPLIALIVARGEHTVSEFRELLP